MVENKTRKLILNKQSFAISRLYQSSPIVMDMMFWELSVKL